MSGISILPVYPPLQSLLEKGSNDHKLATLATYRRHLVLGRAPRDFATAFIADVSDVFSRPGRPIGSSPFDIAFNIRFADCIDGLVAQKADEIPANDWRPIPRLVLAAITTLALAFNKLDELLCDFMKRMDSRCQSVLYAIVRLTPHLIRPMMGLVIVIGVEAFPDLLATG
ncbi:hypothetical protein D0Y60_06650 [Shinella sp. WSJ-2]|nr:hypothetical protein D0Y60_06650 [Shinella sp. WSJ-2]